MKIARRQKFTRRRKYNDDDEDNDETDNDIKQINQRVYFYAPVSTEKVLMLIEKLKEAETYAITHHIGYILLFIHSGGGDAYAGLSAMDHIQISSTPIYCIADGLVASAATFILLAGVESWGMPHSSILIHQLSTEFYGKYAELEDEMYNSSSLMKTIRDIYVSRSNMPAAQVEELMKKDITMTAEECARHGFIKGIYSR